MLTWKGAGFDLSPTREGSKMKYKILKNTIANGVAVKAGDIVELSHSEAIVLKGYGRIEPFQESGIRIAEPPVIENRDPVMPAKRGRPRRGN